MNVLPAITYEQAIIILRNTILQQTGLPSERVLNGYSFYGPDLLKQINRSITESPNLDDTFIIFEFRELESESYGTSQEANGKMAAIAPYGLFCRVYGKKSHEYAQKLLMIFKYPDIAEDLHLRGCFITDISNITPTNEFINSVLWQRADIEIDVICKVITELNLNFVPDGYADKLTKINTIEEGD